MQRGGLWHPDCGPWDEFLCTGAGCGVLGWVVVRWDGSWCTGMGCGAPGQATVHSTKSVGGILRGRDGILWGWQWVSWNGPPRRLFIPSSPALFQLLLEMSPS